MAENLNETNVTNEGQEIETPVEAKTYSQAEVDEMLQRETDRRVSSALKKAEEKNIAKVREAQKLAAMNEQQKFQYELEQREAAIAAKEKALALAENKNEASKILSEKGLSLDLVDFVVAESAEDMNDNIKRLDKAFKQSVKIEVEKRLGSSTPKKNLPDDQYASINKEKFNKMGYAEMKKLKEEQPELWETLTK